MADFDYSTKNEPTKVVPLYHHEQVPFQSFSRQSISSQSSGNHANNNNLMSVSLNSPLANNNFDKQQQQDQQNVTSGDLQEIIYSYQSQPELLRLILLSKLEEDKRRAEEAKLRAKELDILLIQQQQQQQQQIITQQNNSSSDNNNISLTAGSMSNSAANNNPFQQHTFNSASNTNNFSNTHPTPPISSNSSVDGRVFHHMRRTSLDAILASPTHCTPLLSQQHQQQHRRDSTLGSSFAGSADSDEFDDRTFSPIPTSTTPVSASSLLQMESYGSAAAAVISSLHHTTINKQHPLSPSDYQFEDDSFTESLHHQLDHTTTALKSQEQPRYGYPPRPRRRREMQAITKIVETREYPYIDGYFWKNNGNTVQKKTGNKSVYYKCSNSNKGCPVNKTVTWKDHREYLIKYRGEHLLDCNKVQRIVDV